MLRDRDMWSIARAFVCDITGVLQQLISGNMYTVGEFIEKSVSGFLKLFTRHMWMPLTCLVTSNLGELERAPR